jgi:hypothetical protein
MITDQVAPESSGLGRPRSPKVDPIVVRVAIADDDPEALELLRTLRATVKQMLGGVS